MPTRRPLTVGVVAARATAGLVTTGGPAAAAPPDGPAATYVVTVDRSIPPSQAAERARGIGGRIDHVYTAALRGYAVTLSEAAASRLASQPGVVAVERDQVVSVDATQTGATWGLDRIDQQGLPLSDTYSYTATGAGVTAYVIDTGIRSTHREVADSFRPGYDAVGGKNTTEDCNGHGTHVAGTRAVANMSLGGGLSTAIDNAVKGSIEDGVTYAVAAGNESANACTTSPANVPSALTVAASDRADASAPSTNHGTCVDLYAPGVGITSAWYTRTTATKTISGTSMATPHVAGVAALYLQGTPGASPEAVASAITGGATPGRITGEPTGTPDLLLSSAY